MSFRLTSGNGDPLRNTSLRFETVGGTGSVSNETRVDGEWPDPIATDADGIARIIWRLGDEYGMQRLEVGLPEHELPIASFSVEVAGELTRFAEVAVGPRFTCALSEGGQAYCWGTDRDGQLGLGEDAFHHYQDRPAPVTGGHTFSSIVAGGPTPPYGGGYACAIDADGFAWCWGSNEDGQLGVDTATKAAEPVRVAGDQKFVTLAAGDAHVCGLTESGSAYCWGSNEHGQLGTGSLDDESAPTPVAGGLVFNAIAAGAEHTCAITRTGLAYCWGERSAGRLGMGEDADSSGSQTSPASVASPSKFRTIAVGDRHSCGVTVESRGYCWGSNEIGQLGIELDHDQPERPTPVLVSGSLAFQNVTAKGRLTCGTTFDGGGFCWGINNDDQAGSAGGGGMVGYFPAVTPTAILGGLQWATVVAGQQHSCGMSHDGVLHCWGSFGEGALGVGPPGNAEGWPPKVLVP